MGAGWYGKLPMRGDFVGRSLMPDFIQAWDGWLQGVLLAGQEAAGPAWLDHYLNSPIWHFVLGAGLCGPDAMAGVMIASVDAVGRYFPLAVAAVLPGRQVPSRAAPDAAAWCRAAEATALTVLEPEAVFEDFERAVAALGVPPGSAADIGSGPAVASLESGPEALARSLLRVTGDPAQGRASLWWTEGTPTIPAVSLCAAGMPSSQQAVALFDGQWERWGWTRR
jgi:type VI secretion system protein ImpM